MSTGDSRRWRVLLLGLGLWAVTEIHAQQRATTRTTGAQSGSGTTTREYPNSTMVGEAMISSDPETRRVIVITDEDTNLHISQVISNLDRPKPQVLIKVVFLEVSYRNSLDIGFEGGATHQIDATTTGAGGQVFGLSGLSSAATNVPVNALGLPVQNLLPAPPGAGIYQVLGSDFQATFRAIAQAGKTEILSRPSVLTRNNQQATISLGQQVPLVTNTRFDAVNGQINTVTYQNVGIILRVTPFITSEDMVEMIVSPETSGLADRSQWVPIGGDALAPVINSRLADTVVVVPNGQTVIIGGLMENNKLQTDSKIPFLGDIPLLGNLFKRKQKDHTKTELIIFLTPHIVREPSQLAGLSTSERGKTELAPKAFSEQELNRYLDGLPAKEPVPSAAPKSRKK